ncbi:ribosomal protein S18-alanine N-acetyltransferase [Pseudoteredinibacter isoporae]|uniref:[Ribosomal protein bS18]-alanine N-acetyltransferase n=1 Tax=Pseudoteredinibacter isoporae TaxID=570281 RepID=A0A7X0JWY1_9GAMM|nr:ribosomal protein S18-alanine N-acetyltransferase [Pseudoteredinibacter isoporae]MBB6522926.1 ribosomal-protein-alanine N-acetyltransferase [Pseudoteredinibacter isoporae]NHO88452.1 ribosomal protein S18-alanine N-acetyltransferase [Pseudoteredinibacter isoporae]NIB23217.1 ribosomal protein S18-alanine N-acetyltransferase [Pseudoteredinibacter isoporae]
MSELIRPILESDLASLIQIEQQAHSHPWPVNQFSRRLNCERHLHASLEIGGQLAGYYVASQIADQAELLNIAVSPEHQGKAYGARLLKHLIAQLDPSIQEIFLEVRASNGSAIGLYEKLGFHQLGCRPNYYPCQKNGREDALLYALTLNVS